jgi:hypothetical protein
VEDLLQNLIGRGLDPQRKYLFVIDGSNENQAGRESSLRTGCPIATQRRRRDRF